MARIIRLHDEDHWAIQSLLPWYVTGRLEPAEHARVAAHVAGCADCQHELTFEQRLAEEIRALPLDVEAGVQRMARRIRAEPPPVRARPGLGGAFKATWIGWAAAACLVIAGGALIIPRALGALYHALGAAPAATPGNLVVIFAASTPERDMRATLNAIHARIVDGPTGADAYVLSVPAALRAGALTRLRTQADIVLAEPVDPVGSS